jgi:hypothetical protein
MVAITFAHVRDLSPSLPLTKSSFNQVLLQPIYEQLHRIATVEKARKLCAEWRLTLKPRRVA